MINPRAQPTYPMLANQRRCDSGYTSWPGGKPFALNIGSLNARERMRREALTAPPPPPVYRLLPSTRPPVQDPYEGLRLTPQRVYAALLNMAHAGECLPSSAALADRVGASVNAVLAALNKLDALGRIVSVRNACDKRISIEIPGVGVLVE